MSIEYVLRKKIELSMAIEKWPQLRSAPGWSRDRVLAVNYFDQFSDQWNCVEVITSAPASTNKQENQISLSMLMSDVAETPWSTDYGHMKVVRPNRVGEILFRDDTINAKSSGNGPFHSFVLSVNRDIFLRNMKKYHRNFNGNLDSLIRGSIYDPALQSIMQQMKGIVEQPERRSRKSANRILERLAARLVFLIQGQFCDESWLSGKDDCPESIQRVLVYMEQNLSTKHTRNDLARVAELNPRHFTRLFGQITGKTPGKYLIERRVERARDLLRTCKEEHFLERIALECGFTHASHLCREFRQLVGMTPREFQKSL